MNYIQNIITISLNLNHWLTWQVLTACNKFWGGECRSFVHLSTHFSLNNILFQYYQFSTAFFSIRVRNYMFTHISHNAQHFSLNNSLFILDWSVLHHIFSHSCNKLHVHIYYPQCNSKYSSLPPYLRNIMPILDMVAGDAQLKSCVSNKKLTFGPNWILSPEGMVNSLLSSSTEFKDSIHSGSISPSHIIQDWISVIKNNNIHTNV